MTPLQLPDRSDSIGIWLATAAIGTIGAMASAHLGLAAIEEAADGSALDIVSRDAGLDLDDRASDDAPGTAPDGASQGPAAGPATTQPGPTTTQPGPTTVATGAVDCPPSFEVHFQRGSAESDPAALEAEAPALIEWLGHHPEAELVVEGHADSFGAEEANLALSYRRAEAVVDDLVARGAPADRLTPHGLGEYQQMVGEPGESGANRRVSISVPGLESCPGPVGVGS